MNKLFQIPVYIEANSKDDLVRKFLETNAKTGCYNQFFDIQKDGKKWVAWYYQDIKYLSEINNDSAKNAAR